MSWVEKLFDSGLFEREYVETFENDEKTAREADFIAATLGLGPSDSVLDLACGVGRHAFALAGRVGRVVAFDRTTRFLERGRRHAEEAGVTNVEFVEGDMRALDYDGEFDAAYNYFTSWGYYSREENLDCLARARRALKPGGLFLLETINRAALLGRFMPRSWQETPDGTVVLMENELDLAEGRMISRRTYLKGDERETIEIDHEFPAPDGYVERFRAAGFSDVRLLSAPDGGELTRQSWRLAVVGRA